MTTTEKIMQVISELEREAYQKGWTDAFANIMAAASQRMPVTERPVPAVTPPVQKANGQSEPGASVIEVISGIIKDQPGLRGVEVFRRAVAKIPGSDFKTMDRSGRTTLSRLKQRGKIRQRGKKWYPIEEAEKV